MPKEQKEITGGLELDIKLSKEEEELLKKIIEKQVDEL